jgi:hypothetical protein
VEAFLDKDVFPWTDVGNNRWARLGSARDSDYLSVAIEAIPMPWAKWKVPLAGEPGFLYDVNIQARGRRSFDYVLLLEATRRQHHHVVHICLDGDQSCFRVTLPACLGKDTLVTLINAFDDAALSALGSRRETLDADAVQRFADSQPEYVLGPRNALTMLTPDMPGSFFGA